MTLKIIAGIFIAAYLLMYLAVMGVVVALESSASDGEGKP